MKFSGIDMQGEYKAQTVVDASALVYTASDERRIIYDENTKSLWIADDTEWKLLGGLASIPENTTMWVYADSPPDGWSLYAASGDALVAIKGGGTYTTGGDGSTYGSWATPAHQHSLQSHTHTATGNTAAAGTSSSYDTSATIFMASHYHPVSLTTGGPSTNVTAIDGSASGYRPRARVGILCTR